MHPAAATGPDFEADGHRDKLGSSDAQQPEAELPEDSAPGVPGFFKWFGANPGAVSQPAVSQQGDFSRQPTTCRAFSASSSTVEAASECYEESVRQLGRIPRSANILHLALPVDADGFVLQWEQDLQGVVEPSEFAWVSAVTLNLP